MKTKEQSWVCMYKNLDVSGFTKRFLFSCYIRWCWLWYLTHRMSELCLFLCLLLAYILFDTHKKNKIILCCKQQCDCCWSSCLSCGLKILPQNNGEYTLQKFKKKTLEKYILKQSMYTCASWKAPEVYYCS